MIPTAPDTPAPLSAGDFLSLGLTGLLSELVQRLDAPEPVARALRGGGPGLSTAYGEFRSAVDSYLHGDPVALPELLERLEQFELTASILRTTANRIRHFVVANPGSIRTVVTRSDDGRHQAADHRLVGVSDAKSPSTGMSRSSGNGGRPGSNGKPSAG
jgi:hypothetical protein